MIHVVAHGKSMNITSTYIPNAIGVHKDIDDWNSGEILMSGEGPFSNHVKYGDCIINRMGYHKDTFSITIKFYKMAFKDDSEFDRIPTRLIFMGADDHNDVVDIDLMNMKLENDSFLNVEFKSCFTKTDRDFMSRDIVIKINDTDITPDLQKNHSEISKLFTFIHKQFDSGVKFYIKLMDSVKFKDAYTGPKFITSNYDSTLTRVSTSNNLFSFDYRSNPDCMFSDVSFSDSHIWINFVLLRKKPLSINTIKWYINWPYLTEETKLVWNLNIKIQSENTVLFDDSIKAYPSDSFNMLVLNENDPVCKVLHSILKKLGDDKSKNSFNFKISASYTFPEELFK